MTETRTFGYVLATADSTVESSEVQKGLILRYCERIGRDFDDGYLDTADSGKLRLPRPARRQTAHGRKVRRGDQRQ